MNQLISSLAPADPVALRLARLGAPQTTPARAVLFRRGDPENGIYLIIAGAVELSLGTDVSGLLNRTLGAGAILGLPSAMSGEPYSLTATTASPCELLYVPREALVAALKEDPAFGMALLQILAHEVYELRALWPVAAAMAEPALRH